MTVRWGKHPGWVIPASALRASKPLRRHLTSHATTTKLVMPVGITIQAMMIVRLWLEIERVCESSCGAVGMSEEVVSMEDEDTGGEDKALSGKDEV